MALVLRSVKGANLTASEVDGNFTELLNLINDLGPTGDAAVVITDFQVTMNSFKVLMSDGSEFGPYDLPFASMSWEEEWTPATDYEQLDLFTISEGENGGVYLVITAHTSGATFDPDIEDANGAMLKKVFGIPSATRMTVRSETTSAFNVNPPDAGSYLRLTDATGVLITIPTNTHIPMPIGSVFTFRQAGAGALTFEGEDGTVTILSDGTLSTGGLGAVATIIKVGTNTWDLTGGTPV